MTELLATTAPGGLADIELRTLLRLLAFSLLLLWLSCYALPRNPTARRTLLLTACSVMLALPGLLWLWPAPVPVGVGAVPMMTLALPLPGGLALLLLWLLPAFLLMARTLLSDYRLCRALSRLSVPGPEAAGITALLESLACDLKVAVPQLRTGPRICCFGGWRPAQNAVLIVTPALLREDPRSDAQRAALVHELIHLKRRDDRVLLLTQLLLDLYWWMPWLRRVAARVDRALEESCDDRAADFFAPGHRYLEGVLRATCAEHADRWPGDVTGTGTGTRSQLSFMSAHPLRSRVLRFGDRRHFDADWPGSFATVGLLLIGLLTLTGFEPVQRAQPTPRPAKISYGDLSAPPGPTHQVQRIAQASSAPRLFAALLAHEQSERSLPIYPGAALRSHQEATIEVRYRILRDGSIAGIELPRVAPQQAAFARTVRAALAGSRYPPWHQVAAALPLAAGARSQAGPPLTVTERYRFRMANRH